jgi:hypothetical protein
MIRKKLNGLVFLYVFLLCTIPVVHIYLTHLPLSGNLMNVGFLFLLFTFSWLLVHVRIENDPKRFVGNFMVMTVVQFLAFLIYVLVLVVNKTTWIQVIHALILCLILVVLQTMALAKSGKSQSS